MILLNTKYCDKTFVNISSISEIKNTKECDILYFVFNDELCLYAKNNQLSYMVIVKNAKELILANKLEARYILIQNANNKILKKYMQIAQNYLFDSKIICEINSLDDINKIAKTNVDGIYLKINN
jgi:hypothetical protein